MSYWKKLLLAGMWSPFIVLGFICGFMCRGFLAGVRLSDSVGGQEDGNLDML